MGKNKQNLSGYKKSKPGSSVDFFPKDKTPFDTQLAALAEIDQFIDADDERLMVAIIPTAGGKSPIAAAAARYWLDRGRRLKSPAVSAIMCINKALQAQYKKDFSQGDLSPVVGATEFQCLDKKSSCGAESSRRECRRRGIDDSDESRCPYQQHRLSAALSAPRRPLCFNPHSFFAFKKHQRFGSMFNEGGGLLIVDEAHDLPRQLRDFLTLEVPVGLVDSLFLGDEVIGKSLSNSSQQFCFASELFADELDAPRNEHDKPVGILTPGQTQWLRALNEIIREKIALIDKHLGKLDHQWLRSNLWSMPEDASERDYEAHLSLLEHISNQLQQLVAYSGESQWVVEFTKANDQIKLRVRPIVIPKSFLNEFFSGFEKIILMSATIFRSHIEELSLCPPDQHDPWKHIRMFQCQSRIAPSRRKIHLDMINGRQVNYRNTRECFSHFVTLVVDQVCPKLPGQKGIVHVSSHAQAELFCRLGNAYAKKANPKAPEAVFISAGTKGGWKSAYNEFVRTKPGADHPCLFLVAARRYEGIDLAGDLARICIIAKAPYPHTGDVLTQALAAKLPGYIDTSTITSFIQASNRATRGPDDWSLIIALDTNLHSLFSRYGQGCPDYFQEQVEIPVYTDWLDSWSAPDCD